MKNRRFPYGYEMINGEIVICKPEADVVHKIFRDYIDGKALKYIADSLTNDKVEYLPGENKWNKSRIKRMIEDKRYIGDDEYPQILCDNILKEANMIKSGRRTNNNCVVHSKNKELVYSVRCAECGDSLIHKTFNTRKNSENWYCKNNACKTIIKMSVKSLENEVIKIINRIILNPSLAEKEYIHKKTETYLKVKFMENEIERALGQIDFDKESIQNLILECASKRYEIEDSQKHITDRLKADFEKSSPISVFNAEFFSKTVTAVILTKSGDVSLLLKNGNIVGKEKNKNVSASNDNT